MLELGNPCISELKNKKEFLYEVDKELTRKGESTTSHKRYTIIYNCTDSNISKQLRRIGFRSVFCYTGASDSLVQVLMMEIHSKSIIASFKSLFK